MSPNLSSLARREMIKITIWAGYLSNYSLQYTCRQKHFDLIRMRLICMQFWWFYDRTCDRILVKSLKLQRKGLFWKLITSVLRYRLYVITWHIIMEKYKSSAVNTNCLLFIFVWCMLFFCLCIDNMIYL